MPECSLYDIIKMRSGVILYSVNMILLKWVKIYVWLLYICYSQNIWHVSECSLYDIVTFRYGICMNAFYMILLKW